MTAELATYSCQVKPLYASDEPVVLTTTYFVDGQPEKTLDFNAPASYQKGLVVQLVSQVEDTIRYRYTMTSTDKIVDASVTLARSYLSPNTYLISPCKLSSSASSTYMQIRFEIPENALRVSCDVLVVFKSVYDPLLYEDDALYLESSPASQDMFLPAMKPVKADIRVAKTADYVLVTFSNAAANTVTIDNVWGVAGPVKVRSLANGSEIGQAVSSADGRTLTVTFNQLSPDGNGKYSMAPFYLDFVPVHNAILRPVPSAARFSIGSASTTADVDVSGEPSSYSLEASSVDAILKPDNKYEVMLHLYLAGNPADLVLDYTNTGLASVVECLKPATASASQFTSPVTFTTSGSTISLPLTSATVFPATARNIIKVKCVFNSVSAATAQSKVGPWAKEIKVSVKAPSQLTLHSMPLAIAIPFSAPKLAVAHTLTFQRTTLFTSSELLSIAQAYAAGLRTQVPALVDGQVAVTGQKLVESAVKSVIPSSIPNIASTTALEVTFTTTPSESADVSTTVIDAAANDILAAFSAYTVDASSAVDTAVDGECATRCGVGCALCAQNEKCTTNADCIEGYCSSISGVCGTDEVPPDNPDDDGDDNNGDDNAGSTATISIAVLAVLIALTVG